MRSNSTAEKHSGLIASVIVWTPVVMLAGTALGAWIKWFWIGWGFAELCAK